MSFMMNLEKKLCDIVKANEGSRLSYDSESEEYVITFKRHGGFDIPSDCVICGDYIRKENSDKVVCRVKRDD